LHRASQPQSGHRSEWERYNEGPLSGGTGGRVTLGTTLAGPSDAAAGSAVQATRPGACARSVRAPGCRSTSETERSGPGA
jgi:hypothetical protein